MKCPDALIYWTVDEVAECLPVSRLLGQKLWSLLEDAENPTPMGGDGSNGTVEDPSGRLDESNDDKLPNVWNKLTSEEQDEIVAAYAKEY